jgi:hypothetical protein
MYKMCNEIKSDLLFFEDEGTADKLLVCFTYKKYPYERHN